MREAPLAVGGASRDWRSDLAGDCRRTGFYGQRQRAEPEGCRPYFPRPRFFTSGAGGLAAAGASFSQITGAQRNSQPALSIAVDFKNFKKPQSDEPRLWAGAADAGGTAVCGVVESLKKEGWPKTPEWKPRVPAGTECLMGRGFSNTEGRVIHNARETPMWQ